MDEKLLKALNNLSESLDLIAQTLAEKTAESPTAKALDGGDFSTQIKGISEGVKKLQDDNKKILHNQETIIALSKKKEVDSKTGAFQAAGDESTQKSIKGGVSTILLIAAGVLAMGLAFKLIGNVDFLSVVGLSLAIVLISIAFEKVAKLKLSTSDAFKTSKVLVMIAGAMVVSSWIMALIIPIGFTQLLTAVAISLMFALISKNLVEVFVAVLVYDKLKVSPLKLVTALVSIAAAITVSSWVMQLITPISIGQGLTAVFISVTFALISYNLHKIAAGVVSFEKTGVKPEALIKTLLGITAAITLSSWILQAIIPMSFGQLITAVFISAVFAIISFNLEKIALGVIAFKKTKVEPEALIKTLVGIAAAITFSSWILALAIPLTLGQIITSLLITVMFAAMSYVMPELAIGVAIMDKFLGKNKFHLIPLLFVEISAAITLSSWILSKAIPIPFMDLVDLLAMSIFLSIAAITMGISMILLTKIGSISDYIKGGLAIVIISTSIMVSSLILNLGSYEKYPDWKWALGVALSLGAFGIGAILLGTQALNPFFYAGLGIILLVAATVVGTSYILSAGKYEKYPSFNWVTGAGASLAAFGLGAVLLGFNVLNPFFFAGLGMVLLVASTILATSRIFESGKFDASKFPSKDWSDGVSSTISSFVKIMDNMSFGSIIKGVITSLFGGSITDIAKSIVEIDKIFSKGTFTKYPSKAWSEGVAGSIGYMNFIMTKGIKLDNDILGVVDIMVLIAKKVTKSANIWNTDINPNFMNNLGKNIMSYVELAKFVSGNYPGKKGGIIGAVTSVLFGKEATEDPMDRIVSGMLKLGNAYIKLSQSIQKFGSAINGIDPEKLSSIRAFTSNIILMSIMDPVVFESMMDKLEKKAGVFVNIIDDINDATKNGEKLKGVSTSVSANKKPDPTQQQILGILSSMDAKLGTIARNSNTLADYTNELRTGQGVKIKH